MVTSREQAEATFSCHGWPESRSSADRAVTPVGTLREVEFGFKLDGATMTTAMVSLQHAFAQMVQSVVSRGQCPSEAARRCWRVLRPKIENFSNELGICRLFMNLNDVLAPKLNLGSGLQFSSGVRIVVQSVAAVHDSANKFSILATWHVSTHTVVGTNFHFSRNLCPCRAGSIFAPIEG